MEPFHVSKQIKNDSTFQTTPSLIDDLSQQDPQRWATFLRLYGPMLKFWMRRAGVVDEHDQDDILQEVMRSVVSSVQAFKIAPEKGSFRGWLRTIVRRRVVDWMRSKKRKKNQDGEWVSSTVFCETAIENQGLKEQSDRLRDDGPDAEERGETSRLQLRALELIRNEFEERTWQMFWSVTVDGRSTADVASDFSVSTAAVRVAKSRVLSKLKRLIPDM